MPHVKEHRAPVKYSLSAEEASELGEKLRQQGGMTDVQVRKHAKALGCATKPIYMLAKKMGLEIQQTRQAEPKRKSARQKAEELFTIPQTSTPSSSDEQADEMINPPTPTGAEADTSDFDAAVELLAEEERRIADLRSSHEEDLKSREERFAEQSKEARADLEREQERAREAIRKTARLRQATRGDRELIEDLRGTITQLRIENERLRQATGRAEQVAVSHKEELKASMARERRLLNALSQSEADLAECQSRCSEA